MAGTGFDAPPWVPRAICPVTSTNPMSRKRKSSSKFSEERFKNVYQLSRFPKPKGAVNPSLNNSVGNPLSTQTAPSNNQGGPSTGALLPPEKPADQRDTIKHRLQVFERRKSQTAGNLPTDSSR